MTYHMTDEQKRRFAENMRTYMWRARKNQKALSIELGVTSRLLSNYMNARREPHIGMIRAICQALNCTEDELLEGVF